VKFGKIVQIQSQTAPFQFIIAHLVVCWTLSCIIGGSNPEMNFCKGLATPCGRTDQVVVLHLGLITLHVISQMMTGIET